MSESRPRPITETQMKLIKWLMIPFSRFNARRYVRSKGASMGHFGGRDICVASMIGAKSGKRRDVPLMYVPYKQGAILGASLGGAPRHPTWYYQARTDRDIPVFICEPRA